MLNGSGLDCENFSTTLIGWADNPNLPEGLSLGALNMKYGSHAQNARGTILIDQKGWQISGDQLGDCKPVSSDNLEIVSHEISVYPNPSTEEIRLSANTETGILQIQIYNSIGKKIGTFQLDLYPEATIDISDWGVGVYFIHFPENSGIVPRKFVKK